MTSLASLQANFQSAVLNGDDAFADAIISTERVDAPRRIAIYADAYRLRLIEVLQENFPGLHGLLGTEAFEALARRYVDSTPSTFRSARWYGDRFAAFIDDAVDSASCELLCEMARTDWTMGLAFDAADSTSLGEADLAGVNPEQWGALVFGFHPSVRRLDLHHDTPPLRAALAAHQDADAPQRRDPPLPWVFWRQSLRVHFRSMEVDEAFAFDAARHDAPFAEICGGLTEWIDDQNAPLRAVECLKRWLIDDMITHVHVSDA